MKERGRNKQTSICQPLHQLCNSTSLLTNGYIDTVQLLLWKQINVGMNILRRREEGVKDSLGSSPSLKRFWLMIVSMAIAVFLFERER